MLTWGIFAGAMLLASSIRAMGRRKPTWMYNWFRPWGRHGEAGFLRRVRWALSRKNHVYALPLFSPLFTIGVIWLIIASVAPAVSTSFLQGMMIGYSGAIAMAYPFDLTKTLSRYRREIGIFAAQKLARRLPPAVSNAILVPLTESRDANLRIAAAMGLRELGTQEGAEALRALVTDKEADVAAAAQVAYGALTLVYQGKGLLSVRPMDAYAREHDHLRKTLKRKDRSNKGKQARENFEEYARQMDDIVFSQLPLRRAYPDVYCKNCFARGEHQQYEEWDWVRCRQCKEVHALHPGVRQVIGQVGGDADWDLQDGKLRINLWDESQRKAHAADLDVLQVLGGKAIHYDWAVSALVNALHNHDQAIGSRLAVQLVEAPALEANSLQLLKTLDQSLVIGE